MLIYIYIYRIIGIHWDVTGILFWLYCDILGLMWITMGYVEITIPALSYNTSFRYIRCLVVWFWAISHKSGWWFGTWILFFPSYSECHHPNWLSSDRKNNNTFPIFYFFSPILFHNIWDNPSHWISYFSEGRKTTNQLSSSVRFGMTLSVHIQIRRIRSRHVASG